MAAFRLKMATQMGEKIAADMGFSEFPIDPRKIAQSKGIVVQAKPAGVKGVSGALIFVRNDVTLIYSDEYNNEGFENFCIAHELGHYFLPDHPDQIIKAGGHHVSRADFTQNTSIELEADHFASGLMLPSKLVRRFLNRNQVGLEGILRLADAARASRTAAAIRAAECSEYPLAIIVSAGEQIAYAFMSDGFKALGKLAYLKKGTLLPDSATLRFNRDPDNVLSVRQDVGATTLGQWFDGPSKLALDEEIIGLGQYGFTLTVLSSEELPNEPDEEEDEDAELEERWKPKFAYGR